MYAAVVLLLIIMCHLFLDDIIEISIFRAVCFSGLEAHSRVLSPGQIKEMIFQSRLHRKGNMLT